MAYKHLKIVLLLFGMTVMLTGCGKKDGQQRKETGDDGRTVITLGDYDYNGASYYIGDAVNQFNKTSSDYRIESIEYSGREDPVSAFNMDVAAGNCPDILLVGNSYLDRVIHAGLLEDLKPYLEGDAQLHPEDFLDNILEACTTDGHLYYLGNDYGITSIFGKKEQLAGYEDGWTREEMLAYAKSADVPLFYWDDKISLFMYIMDSGITDFVDWDQRKGLFQTDLFREILEYCNKGVKNSDRTAIDPEAVTEFKQDKCRLGMTSFQDFMCIEDTTRFYGTDLTFVGTPREEPCISEIRFNMNIGMYTKSPYKEQAWEFIKLLYTKEAQHELASSGLSVRKDVFAMQKKASIATEPYVDEMGETQEPIDCEAPNFKYTPLTQEEADLVEKLVTSAKYCSRNDNTIEQIVYEEVSAYFNGDCTIDRVGETINSRVETYMNENR